MYVVPGLLCGFTGQVPMGELVTLDLLAEPTEPGHQVWPHTDYTCHFQVDDVPPNHGQLRVFSCRPLPEIPFQCSGGSTEPLCPPVRLHSQEDQTAGGVTRVSTASLLGTYG